MALRLIGVDPDSPNNGSPTVWLDEEDQSIVIQGWKITDDETISEITATEADPRSRDCGEAPGAHGAVSPGGVR